jgi:SNF2 family DNA or RNA helicase
MIETLPESLICDYQYRTSEFIQEHDFCANWIEMGLGKTVSNLMALQDLMDDYMVAHTLIIAPKRVAQKVWTDEIRRWDHIRDFEVQKILGTEKQRIKAMRTPAEIHLINRENVSWLVDQFIQQKQWVKKWHWDNVIIDESVSFSYQSSQRWKQLRRVRKKIDRMVQLTGTPDTRSLRGLWAQMYLLDQGKRLYPAEGDFLNRWFTPPSRHDPANKHIPHYEARKQITRRCRDIVIALRAEDYIKNFEKPRMNYVTVTLSPAERKAYNELEKEYILRFADDIITAVNNGVLANKLLQLANGFIYAEHPKWHVFHDHKIDALMELLEGLSGPVIIAYNFIPDRKRILRALKKAGINHRWLQTEKDEEEWGDGEIDVLVISPKSAGEGTNLHYSGSENLIFFGLIWSLYDYLQTIARLAGGHRAVGRKNAIHHIVAENTYEDRVRQVLTTNENNQKALMADLVEYAESVIRSRSK